MHKIKITVKKTWSCLHKQRKGARSRSVHLPLTPLIFLCLLFALLAGGARRLSFTFDEPSHIAAGYAYLARGATWTVAQRGHPLLVDAWEALPVYIADPHIPLETLKGWETEYLPFVRAFAPYLKRDPTRARFAARVPAMLLTILLAAVVYRWGCDLGGHQVGLVALAILVFDPTLLAHGRLATNDMGVTALGTLGLYLVWRWSQAMTWKRTVLVGLALGMTLLAKGSGLIWAGIGGLWALARLVHTQAKNRAAWLKIVVVGVLGALMLWGAYRFDTGALRGVGLVPAVQHWQALFAHADFAVTEDIMALGILRALPWWACAPLIFCIKNPLPLLLLLPVAIGTLSRCRSFWHTSQLIATFTVVYALFVISRGPGLAYRHALPLHPFLYLLVAASGSILWQHKAWFTRLSLLVLCAWYVGGTLRVYPYNLAFFNEVAGGPENGWRYVSSSNTDWGQAWDALRAFAEQRDISFSYSGPEGYAGLALDDVWDTALPPLNQASQVLFQPWLYPKPGDYVISASSLQGLWLVDPDNFAWFRYHAPDTTIARVLFHYHVTPEMAPDWLAQCTVPAAPLNDQALAAGFAVSDLRQVLFDCQQTWVYPGAGHERGIYALHAEALRAPTYRERLYLAPARPVDAFASRHLAPLPLAFRSWEKGTIPALALYEWSKHPPPQPQVNIAFPSPAEILPQSQDESRTSPVSFDGPLTFLGASVYKEAEQLEIETWWGVTEEGPVTRPLSIMAHLLAQDGTALGVADGLGVSPMVWHPDDVIVQRHRFPAAPSSANLWLRTGVYWLDTGARCPVANASPGTDALFVPIE